MNHIQEEHAVQSAALTARHFRGGLGCFVVALCIALAGVTVRAQGSGNAQTNCVPPDLLRQVRIAGRSVTVQPNDREENGGVEASAATTAGKTGQSESSTGSHVDGYRAFAKAAEAGDPAAQVDLAVAILAGWSWGPQGTAPNGGAALYWLNEAGGQRYAVAYFDLGILYQIGCGVRQDYGEAARYFQLGADANHAPSQMNLGYLYDHGLGVAQDRARAAGWYRKAAEAGLPEAQFNLADLYVRGEGVARDEAAAFAWFTKAAEQGHTTAHIMLAALYAQGRGTTKDLVQAYAWLTLALEHGDGRAQEPLADIAAQLSLAETAVAKAAAAELAEARKRTAETAALH